LRRLRLLATTAAASILAVLGVAPSAEAQVDYFLEINGIPGESQDSKHLKTVEVESWSWGATRAPSESRPTLQAFNVAKEVDLASPPLYQRMASREVIPSMELIARRAGGKQMAYLHYCFQTVLVSSIQTSASSSEPNESVSFEYDTFTERYAPLRADGSLGPSVFSGWNATTGDLMTTYPNPCGI
jgi:type VI secretion system secreted protein Hcp